MHQVSVLSLITVVTEFFAKCKSFQRGRCLLSDVCPRAQHQQFQSSRVLEFQQGRVSISLEASANVLGHACSISSI